MAGDWIKMRTDLLTSPKVVRMASALKADRFRIIGGLLSAWSLFDAHSIDGRLSGYDASALDQLAAWDGFSDAMQAVGWLEIDGDSLILPRFETHNGASAKRRAQESDRKREARKTSADDADKKRTREEKRREEKKEQKTTPPASPAADLLPGISEQVAKDFIAIRKAKKAPLTETAVAGIQREADKAGMSLQSAIELCCARGWSGFKAEWVAGQAGSNVVPLASQPGGGRRAL